LPGFLMAAALGAALWAGVAVVGGWLLRDALPDALAVLERKTGSAVVLAILALVVFIAWKLWQKYRFRRYSALPHITPDELMVAMRSSAPPLLLDLRGATMIAETGAIPGALTAHHDNLHKAVGDLRKDHPIVTLCACPEDAGAVQAARQLLNDGYLSVRPLQGGYDAWMRAVEKTS